MKKIVKIMISLCLGAAVLTGCSGSESNFQEKSYTADETQVNAIKIDVKDRKIEISLSMDDKIHLGYFENDNEYYNITVSDDKKLTMTAEHNKEWSDYIGGNTALSNRTISLQIPEVLLASLELSTTNEDIFIPNLTVKEHVFVYVNNGNIKLDHLNAGNEIKLEAKKGGVEGIIMGSYDDFAITSYAKKGKNNLPEQKAGGAKSLNVSSNDGDIKIEFAAK